LLLRFLKIFVSGIRAKLALFTGSLITLTILILSWTTVSQQTAILTESYEKQAAISKRYISSLVIELNNIAQNLIQVEEFRKQIAEQQKALKVYQTSKTVVQDKKVNLGLFKTNLFGALGTKKVHYVVDTFYSKYLNATELQILEKRIRAQVESYMVKDMWEEGKRNADYFWFQMLAQKGYMVVCVDNRGTPGRGKKFKDIIYGQLGKHETKDQIAAAHHLTSLGFADPSRIGIFGWSYGGYMSSLCILVGANTFKMAIAVAPVTNWRWYDSIYTERFLKTPEENASGYDDYSPVEHAEKLKGKFLLVHGMTDDNVHVQHSIELQRALIDANKTFDCFYYPNQNHGIYKRLHLYKMMTDFIEKNL
jgi:dienelactone hydrolase